MMQNFRRKVILCFLVSALAFFAIIIRVFYVSSPGTLDLPQWRSPNKPIIRGSILDRNGSPLALTIPSQSVSVKPERFRPKDAEADFLADCLGINKNKLALRVKRGTKNFAWFARQISVPIFPDNVNHSIWKDGLYRCFATNSIPSVTSFRKKLSPLPSAAPKDFVRQIPHSNICGTASHNSHLLMKLASGNCGKQFEQTTSEFDAKFQCWNMPLKIFFTAPCQNRTTVQRLLATRLRSQSPRSTQVEQRGEIGRHWRCPQTTRRSLIRIHHSRGSFSRNANSVSSGFLVQT
jgi:hypothetical protein